MLLSLILALTTAYAAPIRLTGQTSATSEIDLADPSRPTFDAQGVHIFTTSGYELHWPTATAFFNGQEPRVEVLKICHNDGTELSLEDGEDIWDPSLEGDVLYGSVMSPRRGHKTAEWPRDAASRRTFAFHFKNGCWRRNKDPLWASSNKDWVGHTYGHEIFEGMIFYERVTEDRGGVPWKTEMFAREMRNPDQTGFTEMPIYEITDEWPALRRESGGLLAEGARPFKIGSTYYISFSSGDYNSPTYGIHLLKSQNLTGPYEPLLNDDETDLKDFASSLEIDRKLTWGAGRGVFFDYDGQWWVIFHGIEAPFDGDEGHRQLYLAPLDPRDLR